MKRTPPTFSGTMEPDQVTGLIPLDGEVPLGNPFPEETIEQTGYGVVAHVPDKWLPNGIGLSGYYVDSQNFVDGADAALAENAHYHLDHGSAI